MTSLDSVSILIGECTRVVETWLGTLNPDLARRVRAADLAILIPDKPEVVTVIVKEPGGDRSATAANLPLDAGLAAAAVAFAREAGAALPPARRQDVGQRVVRGEARLGVGVCGVQAALMLEVKDGQSETLGVFGAALPPAA